MGSATPTVVRAKKFNLNRAQVVDETFLAFVREWSRRSARVEARGSHEAIVAGNRLTRGDAIELFESQIVARHQDIESRAMRARNEGFYTIGSAGHEGNAVVGRL